MRYAYGVLFKDGKDYFTNTGLYIEKEDRPKEIERLRGCIKKEDWEVIEVFEADVDGCVKEARWEIEDQIKRYRKEKGV